MAPRYLLDTDICIYVAKHNPPSVRKRFARHSASELAMSVITFGELRFGAEKSQARDKALATIEALAGMMSVLALPEAAGEDYGLVRASLERKGRAIGNNDLWIAAHARSEGLVLVTNNIREFSRVEGLRVETWV
jgi:tRNA(fMet)-specific endonuclease VapC